MDQLQVDRLTAQGFAQARIITKRFAKTFYFASHFLPKRQKYAAYVVYAICRKSDESVDATPASLNIASLEEMARSINLAYSSQEITSPLLLCFRATIGRFNIPKEYFLELIEGMRMDLTTTRYHSFDELYRYCYRVAGVVGLIMIQIFGYTDKKALDYAINLGIAMQLTNILRDIKEDCGRGRIYLPHEDLDANAVVESDIVQGHLTATMVKMLKSQIQRARAYYAAALPGIPMIKNPPSRLVAAIMANLYAGILDRIEKNGYDVFSKRAHVPFPEKITRVLKLLSQRKSLCT